MIGKAGIGKAGILAIALVLPGVAFAAAPAADTTAHATVKADVKSGATADVKAEAPKPAVKAAKAKAGKAKAKAAPAVDKKTDSEKKTESKS